MAAVDQNQIQKQVAVMFLAFFYPPKFLELTGKENTASSDKVFLKMITKL